MVRKGIAAKKGNGETLPNPGLRLTIFALHATDSDR